MQYLQRRRSLSMRSELRRLRGEGGGEYPKCSPPNVPHPRGSADQTSDHEEASVGTRCAVSSKGGNTAPSVSSQKDKAPSKKMGGSLCRRLYLWSKFLERFFKRFLCRQSYLYVVWKGLFQLTSHEGAPGFHRWGWARRRCRYPLEPRSVHQRSRVTRLGVHNTRK
jgi:hypothetical protein